MAFGHTLYMSLAFSLKGKNRKEKSNPLFEQVMENAAVITPGPHSGSVPFPGGDAEGREEGGSHGRACGSSCPSTQTAPA